MNYCQSYLSPEDIDIAISLLRSGGTITRGRFTKRVEDAIGEKYNGKCVLLSSGTAALHSAISVIGGFGQTVLSPTLTFSAVANAALLSGCRIKLIDVDPVRLHSNTPNGRGNVFVPMDYAGLPWRGNVPHITIRDAAHSFGAKYESYTHAITFSFHPAKHITGGEGGAVVVFDTDTPELLRRFRNNGLDENHLYTTAGLNYHIDEISAAILWSQYQRIDQIVRRRKQIANYYLSHWEHEPRLILPEDREDHVWHIFVLRVANRDAFREYLSRVDIGTQIHYRPLHLQPTLKKVPRQESLAVSETAWNNMVTIPLYPTMTDEQVEYVINKVDEALNVTAAPTA